MKAQNIKNGDYSTDIYNLKSNFVKYYGGSYEDIRIFTAPGRVNLIGEHIDYCGGFVFPAALTLSCTAAVRINGTGRVNMRAEDLEGLYSFDIDNTEEGANLKWGNYQAGVIHWLIKKGYKVRGMDMLFTGNIPFGSGLSSSAAIELTTALAAASLSEEASENQSLCGSRLNIDKVELALIGQKAEHTFCGVSCGIMDQFASAMGIKDNAILLDCASLKYKYVPLKLGDYTLILANTCKKHTLGASEYNRRREEVAEGLIRMNEIMSENRSNLCDYTKEEYCRVRSKLPADKIRDRVEHVIFENGRVIEAVSALEADRLMEFGNIMMQAHASIRDLYEVTGHELDTMFELARHEEGCIGARMTGAGFGGCTVNIVHRDFTDSFIRNVGGAYTKETGITPAFYICSIGDGVREII